MVISVKRIAEARLRGSGQLRGNTTHKIDPSEFGLRSVASTNYSHAQRFISVLLYFPTGGVLTRLRSTDP